MAHDTYEPDMTTLPEVEFEIGDDVVTVVADPDAELREYRLATTHSLRDNLPEDGRAGFSENDRHPRLRSGNLLVDAVFAMAFHEADLASVEEISDGAFNTGEGVACSCFETGEKWNYVWTRDTAYAVDLGLAWVDPDRARRSLEFKLSELKSGGGLEIVQDTGTGGSWPVSTDRVVWAFGARTLLNHLDGADREGFVQRSLEALANTLETDREFVFGEDGLYRGEQSFLDWREQSYASWMAEDPVQIATSRALSTNVGHLAGLRLAADLAQELGDSRAERYQNWADELADAIDDTFWLEDEGMWSSMTGPNPSAPALRKFDLLGNSLAVLEELGASGSQRSAVASYPHAEYGPPVLHPQQPLIPIYHNRGMWPFVTAYGLLAARKTGNDAVFSRDFFSLVRGAALNLSHMENFEFQTQQNFFEDGDYSGPVVNSRRQLWSVAGFIGATVEGLFGVEARDGRLYFEPFVTPELSDLYFGESETLELRGLSWRGAQFDVELRLPASNEGQGAFEVASTTLNGAALQDGVNDPASLDGQRIVVELVASGAPAEEMTEYPEGADFKEFFAPREPTITGLERSGDTLTVDYNPSGESGVVFNVWRDGVQLVEGTADTQFVDAVDPTVASPCYTVEAVFESSGHHSHPSRPACWRGAGDELVETIPVWHLRSTGGTWSTEHGRVHIGDWGQPDDEVLSIPFRPRRSGSYDIRVIYGNGSGGITTGITAAAKRMTIATQDQEITDTVVMPTLGDWLRWSVSSPISADLSADTNYTFKLSDAQNMSYFEHFRPYTGGAGGGESTFNAANIHAIELIGRTGASSASPPALNLTGESDFDKFDAEDRYEPGAPLEDWSRTAVAYDDRYLYLVQVSRAFEEPFAAWNVYIGTPGTGDGLEYSNLTAALPIDANWLISTRRSNDLADPWNGIWKFDSGWNRIARLQPQVDHWLSDDQHTLSVRIPRAIFEDAENLWMVSHVVWAQPANEWKEVFPSTHTPWADGGEAHALGLDR